MDEINLSELYKEEMEKAPTNMYYSLRLLQKCLEEKQFTTEEINLLRILIDKLIHSEDSRKKLLLSIQKEISDSQT